MTVLSRKSHVKGVKDVNGRSERAGIGRKFTGGHR
jgi:hypothetical protein